MKQKYLKPTLVINIKRKFFADILAQPRRKKVEYREMSKYWINRLERVGTPPFHMRMLNGMTPPVPEATILVTKVVKNKKTKEFEIHLGKILEVKNWDRKKRKAKLSTHHFPNRLG